MRMGHRTGRLQSGKWKMGNRVEDYVSTLHENNARVIFISRQNALLADKGASMSGF